MAQAPEAIVAGPMVLMSGVISNHDGKIAHSKGIVCHGVILPARTWEVSEKGCVFEVNG
jgi:hypothetical protein